MAVVIQELEVQQPPEPPASAGSSSAGPAAPARTEIEPQPLAEALARLDWLHARVHAD